MPGGRRHGIVDGDHRQGGDGEAVGLQGIHFGNLLLQRAARQRLPEGGILEAALLAVGKPVGTRILALVVAEYAVMGLVEGVFEVHARIGQGEAVARARGVIGAEFQLTDAVVILRLHIHQVHGVDLFGELEQHAGGEALAAHGRKRGPGGELFRRRYGLGVGLLVGEPAHHRRGEGFLGKRPDHLGELDLQGRAVDELRVVPLDLLHGAALHEQTLAAEQRGECNVARRQGGDFVLDPEQGADEVLQMGAEVDDEPGMILGVQRVGRGARRRQANMEFAVRRLEVVGKGSVHTAEAVTVVEVLESEAERQFKIAHGT